MAPALTKILKDGHGIHLSSPAASVRMDSDERAMCSAESQIWSADSGDLQKLWLNLSLFPSLDSGLLARPLDVSDGSVLSPFLHASQCETAPPSSSASLLSFSKIPGHSHQVACVFPGVPNMFFVPVAEHNSQDASLLHGCSTAPECGPDGGDVHHSPLIQTSVPGSHSHMEMNSQGDASFLAPRPTPAQGKVPVMHCSPPSPLQHCSNRMDPEKLASTAVLEAAVKEQVSRQAGLHSRAQGLQKRLQSLLGEHATNHCTQQLEGLKRQVQRGAVSLNSPDFTRSPSPPHCPRLEPFPAWSLFTELTEFCLSNQAVLRGLHESLDSEATASSSSDEEQELDKIRGKTKTSAVSSCERRWLEDRAELGSRWSWLQLRLAQLEGRVQQLAELHKHIRSTKGGVVLAASQPLTDRQIQQTLLREMAGLTCTASDADAEPCSPTRLLQNIERQSAQLNQIVNCLMPPLSFSPLSKQSHRWKGKRDFTSCQNGDGVFLPGSSKRRKLWTRKLLKADVSCVCARTRPLVTYHKPKLFTFNSKSSGPQDLAESMPTLSSSLSSCSCCSTCDPTVLCSDPDCSSTSTSTRRSTPHSLLSLPYDTPLSQHSKMVPGREEWTQRSVFMNDRSSRSSPFNRGSSTPLHNSHTYKHRKRHRDSRVLGLSPIVMAGSAQAPHRRANQRKGKRRHIHRLIQDEEEDVLYQVCHPDSSDEVLEESYTQVSRKQTPQGFVRKRQGESVYNINNVVIPVSLTKVEKLQYKDILTPSWRVVDTSSLMSSGAEKVDEEGQVEDLANKIFTQRHLDLEQREKLRWSSWGKRKCCRRLKSSGSRLSASRGGMCTSGEESSLETSCAQLDTDEQQSTEEWLPQMPWEPRVFPLAEAEEDALLSESLNAAPSGCSEWSYDFSNPQPSPATSSGATLLSSGQSQSCTAIVC